MRKPHDWSLKVGKVGGKEVEPANDTIMHVRFITPPDFLTMLDTLYPDANLRQRIIDAGGQLP